MGCLIIFINIFLDKWVITKVVGTCRLYDIFYTYLSVLITTSGPLSIKTKNPLENRPLVKVV